MTIQTAETTAPNNGLLLRALRALALRFAPGHAASPHVSNPGTLADIGSAWVDQKGRLGQERLEVNSAFGRKPTGAARGKSDGLPRWLTALVVLLLVGPAVAYMIAGAVYASVLGLWGSFFNAFIRFAIYIGLFIALTWKRRRTLQARLAWYGFICIGAVAGMVSTLIGFRIGTVEGGTVGALALGVYYGSFYAFLHWLFFYLSED